MATQFDNLHIGTAGWSYPDWRGVVYDRDSAGLHPLASLGRYLDAAEINTSFYRVPAPEHAETWLRALAEHPRFLLTMKLWRGFTHEAASVDSPEARGFHRVAERLAASGRLAGVLAQFPWSFKHGPAALGRLDALAREFGRWRLVVEVRHGSWMREEFFEFLRERDCAFCNIDQPVIGESIAPTEIVTAAPAYVRLHGRRHDTWFAEDAPSHERYNYLYNAEELGQWAERIRRLLPKGEKTLIIANNHYQGQAVVNAVELKGLLTGERPPAPPGLLRAYPRLRETCREDSPIPPEGRQLELF